MPTQFDDLLCTDDFLSIFVLIYMFATGLLSVSSNHPRTSHIGLNAYLYRIKVVDSPTCTHCREPESVAHFFLRCRRYTIQRHHLRLALADLDATLNLKTLFPCLEPYARALLAYVHATERFPRYFDFIEHDCPSR